jgi:hypothetical protein
MKRGLHIPATYLHGLRGSAHSEPCLSCGKGSTAHKPTREKSQEWTFMKPI